MRFLGYEVKTGMFSWLLHRITGVGITIFLFFHIWTQTQIYGGPEKFNAVMEFYKSPLIKISEILLMGAIIFHALNGLRIVIVDFAEGSRYHKKLFWGAMAATAVLFLVGTWIVVSRTMLH